VKVFNILDLILETNIKEFRQRLFVSEIVEVNNFEDTERFELSLNIIKIILKITAKLLKNGYNKEVYNSTEVFLLFIYILHFLIIESFLMNL
jgi:uncharacterized protein with von Willebrand factor type A (vWA) domain